MMATAKLKIHGHVREYLPGGRGSFDVEFRPPATVRELLAHAGINPDLVAVIFVDGAQRDKDFVVEGDSEIMLLSPVAGG